MAVENPTWGAERILGELQMAGYRLHINTLRKYMPKHAKTPGGNWKNFLDLHASQTAAMDWLRQNLKEALADSLTSPNYIMHDNDPVFVHSRLFMESVLSITPLKTAPLSPWQNGYAERFVGTIRRELTDHVIPLSENHLRSLVIEYMRHYNEDRTHSSLGKDSPHGRLRAEMPPDRPLISVPRFRGLHHRYFPMEKVA